MRITLKYIKEALQKEFDRLDIPAKVTDIWKTRCRDYEYESGAAHYIVMSRYEDSDFDFPVYVFYPLWYLQKELNNGYELYLNLRDGKYIRESELNIRKSLQPNIN